MRWLTGFAPLSAALLLLTAASGCGGGGTTGTAPNEAPSVRIVTPASETSFREGEEITFEATASDPEEGELTGEAIVWESRELAGVPLDQVELDGRIGTGTRFSRDDLSFGHHVITVTATDSEGETATAEIEIGVGLGAPLMARIVFLRGRFDDPSNVWVMDPDGSNARALGLTRGFALDVSPDGRFVAYDRPDGSQGPPDIWVRDVVEGWKTRLTDDDGRDKLPHFSPDGSKILFWSSRTGTNEIFLMNADGTGVTQVTDDLDLENLEGDWSPDGARIVFRRSAGDVNGGGDLWVMDADGGNQVQLTDTPEDQDFCPEWSPDGTKIVYSKLRSDDFRIWLVNADGNNPRELANSLGTGDELADWSPDGSVVVFTSARTGSAEIFGINVDGTGLTRITDNDVSDSYPVWVSGP